MGASEELPSKTRGWRRPSGNASIFRALRDREVRPSRIALRPDLGTMSSSTSVDGSGVLQLDGNPVAAPPLAISFSKKIGDGNYLAIADEEGYVSVFNTRCRLPSAMDSPSRTEAIRRLMWLAHSNAVFDISWLRDDTRMLTASGDQTVRLWDVEAQKKVAVMKGHSGSVKSVCGHPAQSDVFVSGARDGNIAFWDARGSSSHSGPSLSPVAVVKDAHLIVHNKKSTRKKTSVNSVTAVLYLKDECLLASAGAADGVLKFWDVRNLRKPVTQSPPQRPHSSGRLHGIAGLSQNPSGTRLIASCTDSKIYLFDVLHPEKGHSESFSGHVIKSFYIKATFSPDGSHILSGSTDGNVFIWKVDRPEFDPVILSGHGGEVTAVDWCPTDICKIATCSDDYTVRLWRAREANFQSQQQPPCSMRRRVCANPSATRDLEACAPRKRPDSSRMSLEPSFPVQEYDCKENLASMEAVPVCPRPPEIVARPPEIEASPLVCLDANTQDFTRRRAGSALASKLDSSHSSSSILSPHALKRQRTIVDYFRCT